MSTIFRVSAGDTFESIARRAYGTEQAASTIARANPGATEPLVPGTSLIVPDLPAAPQNVPQAAAAVDQDEVALLVGGKRFRFWGQIRITRALDGIDTIEFSAPFESEAEGFRETFRPFSFKKLEVTVGGEPFFTGTLIGVSPAVETKKKVLALSGYALPGVLNDCTPPASAFPLEFVNVGLRDIATTLAALFGLSVKFEAEQGAVFERVAIAPGKKVLTFLSELAKQRNLVLSSTARGELLFRQSKENQVPVARFEQGVPPVQAVTPFFSPQEYYSHVTGIEPALVGLPGEQFTVKNPHLSDQIRPLTFTVADTLDADVKTAVETKIGRMFGNMVSYSVPVPTWRDKSGALWTPGSAVTLLAPDAMVYNEYDFIIRSIEFFREGRSRTATLNLTIPGAFSGKVPETLPWD